jgi:hypothetical protein
MHSFPGTFHTPAHNTLLAVDFDAGAMPSYTKALEFDVSALEFYTSAMFTYTRALEFYISAFEFYTSASFTYASAIKFYASGILLTRVRSIFT